jgi:hypothetical protein
LTVLTRFTGGDPVGKDELNTIVDAVNLVDMRVPDVSKYWTWNGVNNGRSYDNKTGQKKMIITSGVQLVNGSTLSASNSKQIPVRFGVTFSETPAVIAIAHGAEVMPVSILSSSLSVTGFTAYLTQDVPTSAWNIHAISYIAIGV